MVIRVYLGHKFSYKLFLLEFIELTLILEVKRNKNLPYLLLFCSKPSKMQFFSKKVFKRFCWYEKRSYLCTRFPKGRHKNRSLTDCEQKKDKQRIYTLYIINICTSKSRFHKL